MDKPIDVFDKRFQKFVDWAWNDGKGPPHRTIVLKRRDNRTDDRWTRCPGTWTG